MSEKLLSPYTLGPLSLKNRVVMCPLTRSRATENIPNSLMATYYRQRAGAGLIITEGTAPSPNGLGYPRIPGCYTKEQSMGWAQVTDAVHEAGGKIALQIMHCGRVCHPDNMPPGGRILAPSAVPMTQTKMYVDGKGEQPIPLATPMTYADMEETIEEYVTCAKLAAESGFDAIELHAANGYLLEQFINPTTNKRDDQYGGSVENRLRFVRNVAEAVVAAVGAERVGMRISPYGMLNDMQHYDSIDETYLALVDLANELDLLYLHIADLSGMGAPEVPRPLEEQLRQRFNNSFILSGDYDEIEAELDINMDRGDLVAFGRPFISNPDLVERFRKDAPLTLFDQATFYTPGPEGYIDYPMLEG